MCKGYKAFLPVLILALVLSLGGMIACAEKSSVQTQVPIAPNDSNITGKLVVARVSSGPLPWEIDIEVYSSQDVPDYPNFTKEKIGEIITVQTGQYPQGFQIGQGISAHVRLEGDERSSFYFAWDIK